MASKADTRLPHLDEPPDIPVSAREHPEAVASGGRGSAPRPDPCAGTRPIDDAARRNVALLDNLDAYVDALTDWAARQA